MNAAISSGVQQPQNCSNPCSTRISVYASIANKRAYAEWNVVDNNKVGQKIKAQAFCQGSAGSAWTQAASWAFPSNVSSKICNVSGYTNGITANGYVWSQ